MIKSSHKQTVRLLVVDTQPHTAAHIQTLLSHIEGQSYQVKAFITIEEACLFLESNKADVILAGLAGQGENKLDVLDRFKQVCPQIPIFIVGDERDDALALRVVGAGAQDYLIRSTFNSTMLSRVVRYAIERKKFESHIHIAQEKYRTIFEKSAAAITVTDGEKRIISWNRQAEVLLGLSKETLQGKPVHELYPMEEWEKIRIYQDEDRDEQDYLETQILLPSGDRVDVGLSLSTIHDPEGHLTGSIGILQNISEKKRIERMKDEFISTVSHELRTPLTIMRESVSQVRDRILGEINAEQEMILGLALEGIDRLTRIVNDLLDMSALEAGKVTLNLETFDLVAAAREVLQSFSVKAAGLGLQLELIGAEKLPLRADRDKMIQVMTNLVGNALKFTERGFVRIEIEDAERSVTVRVLDTGRGIHENDLSKLFEKFQQFGRVPGPGDRGTGLGLSICKAIMDLHLGTIGVKSEPQKGSCFYFTLPK